MSEDRFYSDAEFRVQVTVTVEDVDTVRTREFRGYTGSMPAYEEMHYIDEDEVIRRGLDMLEEEVRDHEDGLRGWLLEHSDLA